MNDDQWRSHFRNQKLQGISIAAYLKANGIKSARWYYHQKRLEKTKGFAQVKITEARPARKNDQLSISIEAGVEAGGKLVVCSGSMATLTSFLTAGLNEAS